MAIVEAGTPAVGLGGQGEEVGDNGLAPQPPVLSVLHKTMTKVARGVAHEWDDRFANSKDSRTQRKFKPKYCRLSDNTQFGVLAAAWLGSVYKEIRAMRAEFPNMSEGEAARMVAVCGGDNLDLDLRAIV